MSRLLQTPIPAPAAVSREHNIEQHDIEQPQFEQREYGGESIPVGLAVKCSAERRPESDEHHLEYVVDCRPDHFEQLTDTQQAGPRLHVTVVTFSAPLEREDTFDQMLQRAAKAVHPPNVHRIEFSKLRAGHQA